MGQMTNREIDALIWTKVFGRDPDANHERGCHTCGSATTYHPGDDPYPLPPKRIPPYSTDIAAAWLVVERIKSLKPSPETFGLGPDYRQDFVLRFEAGKWLCGWEPFNLDGVTTLEAEADTAPMAIALAALKSLGVTAET